MITIARSETWPPGRLFAPQTARRTIAELVLDKNLLPGDLVDINGTTCRVTLGAVLLAVEGNGPHLRAVDGRTARLVRVTEDEARAIEWLELHQVEIDAYVAEAT
ncbi:MAG: hypothetical protein ABIG63_07035 [Chloroflexota bacterium]